MQPPSSRTWRRPCGAQTKAWIFSSFFVYAATRRNDLPGVETFRHVWMACSHANMQRAVSDSRDMSLRVSLRGEYMSVWLLTTAPYHVDGSITMGLQIRPAVRGNKRAGGRVTNHGHMMRR